MFRQPRRPLTESRIRRPDCLARLDHHAEAEAFVEPAWVTSPLGADPHIRRSIGAQADRPRGERATEAGAAARGMHEHLTHLAAAVVRLHLSEADRAILLETAGGEWDPVSTAGVIAETIETQEQANGPFDLIFFGNEAADTGDFQVGVRVAVALGRPIINGIKEIWFRDDRRAVFARREAPGGGWETYELPLPAVLGVKEGLNLPRYPSVPAKLRAQRKPVDSSSTVKE